MMLSDVCLFCLSGVSLSLSHTSGLIREQTGLGKVGRLKLKGSVKEPNKFHNYETEKITHKASDVAEYIELFGSFTRDRHARRINVIL